MLITQGGCQGTPPASCFGVSPPCRNGWTGGAANPAAHDSSWSQESSWSTSAVKACRKSLATLRELDTTGGPSFLRGDLLVGSPPMGMGSSPPMQVQHMQGMQAPVQQQQQPTPAMAMRAASMVQPVGGGGGDGLPFSCRTQYFSLHQ